MGKIEEINTNSWGKDQGWRKIEPWDEKEAENSRLALLHLYFYSTSMVSQDTERDEEDRNTRAALHTIIDELTREDLFAVFKLTRALVLTPGQVKIFIKIAHDQNEKFLEDYRKDILRRHPEFIGSTK